MKDKKTAARPTAPKPGTVRIGDGTKTWTPKVRIGDGTKSW